ncbi:helix-turn-helix transcriptional regulator [Paenibacillus flagellatus]|uniref:AraC family transcriptional regulator n=1 Tax=Paenibacillus flagellatus TaxID=2211139 RepID=A0A2V5JYT3_9BACL|nr:AraC family transcriptional regulator [Paenibacillus flagellatus]PYI52049.1 AraC family transcriptional regulator [Paenibacillus flagellatus]
MAIKWIDLSRNQIDIYEQKHMGGHLVSDHHHQIHQLLFVLEGEGRLRLEGAAHGLSGNDAVLIAPYAVHSVMSDSKLTLLVLAFDESALDPEVAEQLLRGPFRHSVVLKPSLFAGSELRQHLRRMLFEQSKGPSALTRLSLKIHLSHILLVLARSAEAPQAAADSNRLRADKIRHYIDMHYYEPLTAGDLAAKLGISTRYVNNIFKERYDRTPMQYLTEVRIRVAQKLLAETGKDIISIGFEVGYDSVSTFYRTFKAVADMSPKKYRELHPDRSEE